MQTEYDVVVVGGSIAGTSTAMFLGRAGLRVAVLERSRNIDAYKAMCGHWILGGTKPTLERLDLWDAMVAEGADVAWPRVWGGDGWIEAATDGVPASIALRRSKLDPLLRRHAAATPGVDLVLDCAVLAVVRDESGRLVGAETADGRVFRAPLIVGADGHRSPVARAAGVAEDTAPNNRFLWWAYYEGLGLPQDRALVWPADPDGGVITPAGNGLHLVGAFPSKARTGEFRADRVAALERYVAAMPDAPDLGRGRRVSAAIGTSDYPFVKRDPLPEPGLALVGDAAMASDPLPAVGCGWAFRTAEWLADAVIAARRDGEDLHVALELYREARAFAEQFDTMARADAVTLVHSDAQRALRRAAVHDPELARRLGLFAARAAGPEVLFAPAPA